MASRSSKSRRFQASIARRTISTFSCDIAYAVSRRAATKRGAVSPCPPAPRHQNSLPAHSTGIRLWPLETADGTMANDESPPQRALIELNNGAAPAHQGGLKGGLARPQESDFPPSAHSNRTGSGRVCSLTVRGERARSPSWLGLDLSRQSRCPLPPVVPLFQRLAALLPQPGQLHIPLAMCEPQRYGSPGQAYVQVARGRATATADQRQHAGPLALNRGHKQPHLRRLSYHPPSLLKRASTRSRSAATPFGGRSLALAACGRGVREGRNGGAAISTTAGWIAVEKRIFRAYSRSPAASTAYRGLPSRHRTEDSPLGAVAWP